MYMNMPGDATILEGPVTPAPLFAYRAIRGIFFNSPDSSPEHYNKENMVPTSAKSPTKSKGRVPSSPQLTPSQKRKREVAINGGVGVSPTKGILRTPGLATPRAKYLKDVNVKFKSVSPEVRRTNAIVQNTSLAVPRAQHALEAIRPEESTTALANVKEAQKPEAQASRAKINEVPSASSPSPGEPAAIEAYMAQTEKEMRRLIRYGKKMREYALKKDAENQELKMMIDELRRENERIRTSGANPSGAVPRNLGLDLKSIEGELSHKNKSEAAPTTSKAISPALRNKTRGYVREEVDRVETTVKIQASTDTKSQQRSFSETARPDPAPTRALSTGRRQAGSTTTTTVTPKPSNPIQHDASKDADVASKPGSTSNAATNNGTFRLPPDRAAAARERLRKRAEARRTSAESGLATKDQVEDMVVVHAMPHALAKVREAAEGLDEPSLDWVNL